MVVLMAATEKQWKSHLLLNPTTIIPKNTNKEIKNNNNKKKTKIRRKEKRRKSGYFTFEYSTS